MRTSGLGRFQLGQSVPDRPHAVCVSLPEVSDLIGYEERHPVTLDAMQSGYPRFVRHPTIQRVIEVLQGDRLDAGSGYLFTRAVDCEEALSRYEIRKCEVIRYDDFTLLELPLECPKNSLVSAHFQHTGCGISSRLAEEFLWNRGLLDEREEVPACENSESIIRKILGQAHGCPVQENDLILTSSGANAFQAIFGAAHDLLRKKGKTIWLRWGWLYLDTIEVMNLYAGEDTKVVSIHQVGDERRLEEFFLSYGDRIAGVVTEFPTNPLLQSGNLEKLRSLCDDHDALLIVDPTMASPMNAKISQLADVVVNSLTKYAGLKGDLMMGSLAFPRSSEIGRSLMESTRLRTCPPYFRDLDRLAEQITEYPDFVSQTNSACMRIAEFLENHAGVSKLHWAYQEKFRENYGRLAGEDSPGCVLSFELKEDFNAFYNRLNMLKSPSFGTEFSICCPYVYLAHYELTKTDKGRCVLREAGLSPQLLRLSVGLESTEEIIETLDRALL